MPRKTAKQLRQEKPSLLTSLLEAIKAPKKKPRRVYKRRDMRAE